MFEFKIKLLRTPGTFCKCLNITYKYKLLYYLKFTLAPNWCLLHFPCCGLPVPPRVKDHTRSISRVTGNREEYNEFQCTTARRYKVTVTLDARDFSLPTRYEAFAFPFPRIDMQPDVGDPIADDTARFVSSSLVTA